MPLATGWLASCHSLTKASTTDRLSVTFCQAAACAREVLHSQVLAHWQAACLSGRREKETGRWKCC